VIERLPARVRTPAVARAMLSPSALLLAGAAAAAAILAGAALPLAPVAAVAAWAGRVALAVPRRQRGDRIDPFTVGDPWRRFVQDAQQAKTRFDKVVAGTAPGPLQQRLETIGARIDDGVTACWRIARQGHNLQGGLRQFDIAEVERETSELADERSRLGADDPAATALDRTKRALDAQRASYERLHSVWQDAQTKLRVLNAQLDEAVARAVEISLHPADESALSPLGSDVDQLVGELESLRQALEETSATPGASATGTF
jgi:hypothetical protein